ncbi:MAG: peptidoglycan editing factor PgeF [Firmicutes bacterium]|nr:peptidoglycan editing factor PgeF [Bacillota bacterium]
MRFRVEESRVVFDVHPSVSAWFSTRRGGVSAPPFDTLNLSYGVGDAASAVNENRRRILDTAGRDLADLVMPHQVHGNRVEWVTDAARGRGARGAQPIEATDGLLTDSPHVVLGLGFADCVPIFLTDREARFVGLLHAGWRGTAAKIAERAVTLIKARGISPADLLAGIGPSIGPCCYEVDQPVHDAIVQAIGDQPLAPKDARHWWLDLQGANRLILERAGVWPEHILEAGLCTGCRRDLFFSYRMEGRRTGRMGGYICLNAR